MDRQTFLASLPATAVAAPAIAEASADISRWHTGADRFERLDVRAGDRPVGASFATRTAAYGQSGAVATAHPLATLAGIETLKRGGSAVDAAIAVNACLGFLEPTACGIGGDFYAMLWNPKAGKVEGLAGSGASPRSLDLATVRSRARNGSLPPLERFHDGRNHVGFPFR